MKKSLVNIVFMVFVILGFTVSSFALPLDNLLVNGDFESSTPLQGWDAYGAVKLASAKYHPELAGMDGRFALLGQCVTVGDAVLSQTFALDENTDKIHLTFDWALSYFDMSCNMNDTLFVLYQNTGEAQENALVKNITLADLIPVADTYDQTLCAFGAKSGTFDGYFDVDGALEGTLSFTLQEVNAGFFCWLEKTDSVAGIDNVSVTAIPNEAAPVPEPATLILLGSGLIGFAGFRRKRN